VVATIIGVVVSGLFALLVAYIIMALFDAVFELGKL
jgi:hypothetical protein